MYTLGSANTRPLGRERTGPLISGQPARNTSRKPKRQHQCKAMAINTMHDRQWRIGRVQGGTWTRGSGATLPQTLLRAGHSYEPVSHALPLHSRQAELGSPLLGAWPNPARVSPGKHKYGCFPHAQRLLLMSTMPSFLQLEQQVGVLSPEKPKFGRFPHAQRSLFLMSTMPSFLHLEQQVGVLSPGKP